jgi:hypothetical protein
LLKHNYRLEFFICQFNTLFRLLTLYCFIWILMKNMSITEVFVSTPQLSGNGIRRGLVIAKMSQIKTVTSFWKPQHTLSQFVLLYLCLSRLSKLMLFYIYYRLSLPLICGKWHFSTNVIGCKKKLYEWLMRGVFETPNCNSITAQSLPQVNISFLFDKFAAELHSYWTFPVQKFCLKTFFCNQLHWYVEVIKSLK